MEPIELLPRPWLVKGSRPLLKPFKWGTVWLFISRGIKTATTLRFKLSTLLNKSRLFWIFKLRLLVVLMPLEVECHTVPHLKALTRVLEHASGHGRGSTFTWHYTHLKTIYLIQRQTNLSICTQLYLMFFTFQINQTDRFEGSYPYFPVVLVKLSSWVFFETQSLP